MKPFTRQELVVLFLTLMFVFFFTFKGLVEAERKARDAQRKADLGVISDALHSFFEVNGYFPPSENGKIKMCRGENFEKVVNELKGEGNFDRNKFFEGLRGCEWGKDSLENLLNSSDIFLKTLPADPRTDRGITYLYLSNTARFQLYAYLEGEEKEEGFGEKIVSRNLYCGEKVCSFGKSSGDTPLDISIEDYEKSLIQK